uniref:Uncharacterized protein n=1 Tax=Oryza glumipatula TaxID=40148 RepID=A0A0D9Z9S7_9ORYZ
MAAAAVGAPRGGTATDGVGGAARWRRRISWAAAAPMVARWWRRPLEEEEAVRPGWAALSGPARLGRRPERREEGKEKKRGRGQMGVWPKLNRKF